MWGQLLLNHGKLAIKFDAWKADHSDNPLLSLIIQLSAQLEELGKNSNTINNFKNAGISLCKAFMPATLKFGVNLLLNVAGIDGPAKEYVAELSSAANKIIENDIENKIQNCNNEKKVIDDFKAMLREIAKDQILFIFVDELDRCKPTFATELLEKIKHIFNVKNVCFILVTNMKSLSNLISIIYGHNDVEAHDYLERFVNFPSLSLPEPNREKFIEYQLKEIQIDIDSSSGGNLFLETVLICCNSGNLSLRVIEKLLMDFRLFLLTNKSIESDVKVPIVYYPVIAHILANRRIKDVSCLNSIQSDLFKISIYKWIYEFFLSSSSREQLTKQVNKLNDQINSIKGKSSYNRDEGIILQELEYIKDKIVSSLHKGTKPDMLYYATDIILNVNFYQNHHKNGMQIINLFSCMKINESPI